MEVREVIEAFVAHLAQRGYPGLVVEERPDESNRTSSDIDALAGPFAIEHTSVDALPDQRQQESWVRQVTGGLADEIPIRPDCRLRITFDFLAVRQGQDWGRIRQGLKSWLLDAARCLDDGVHVVSSVPDVPFPVHVRKSSGRRGGLSFGLFAPDDLSLGERLQAHLGRKAAKLARYQKAGRTTILLVESADLQLMDPSILEEAGWRALGGRLPEGVDQLWYADTSIPGFLEFVELRPSRGVRCAWRRSCLDWWC